MIILDTNVVSEIMKSSPSKEVSAWLSQQQSFTLFITSITIAEICYGLNALPSGSRRESLYTAFHQAVMEAFEHRMLPFDESAAQIYGHFMAQRKSIGKPMSILDGQISAIAYSRGMAIATRNIRDFSDCGLTLINPFLENLQP